MHESWANLIDEIGEKNESTVKRAEMLLKQQSKLDEADLVGSVKLAEILMDLYIEQGLDHKAVEVAIENLLVPYKNYFPPFHPTIGFLLLKIAKLFANLDELSKCKVYLEQVINYNCFFNGKS